MLYSSRVKEYVCKSCGLTLTLQELVEIRENLKRKQEIDEEGGDKKKLKKEYLQWWLSRKE